MNVALFILGMLLLIETIFSQLIEKYSSSNKFLFFLNQLNSKNKGLFVFVSVSMLLTAFVLSEVDKYQERQKTLERENQVLELKVQAKTLELKAKEAEVQMLKYREKLNEANSLIKQIAIKFSVNFETSKKIHSENQLIGPGLVYAMVGPNVALTANGISFRFIPYSETRYTIELNAGLSDGDFPTGNKIEMFKDYKDLRIFIPFFANDHQPLSSFKVNNYSILLTINGVQVDPINSFQPNEFPIDSGPYTNRPDNIYGTVTYKFKKNLFEDLNLKRHLKSF